jgi:dinuclear metal center YbgI/SA1388 family protein
VLEAVERDVQCIVAHHPVIFHPLKSIRTDSSGGALIAEILRANLNIIAMHTNADASKRGLNTALADLLKLKDVHPLDPTHGQRKKLIFRTLDDVELRVLWKKQLDEYDDVRWSSHRLDDGDTRIIVETPVWLEGRIRSDIAALLRNALKSTHSEHMEDAQSEFGIGAIGLLPQSYTAESFLAFVKEVLGCEYLRTSPFEENRVIRKVAVCSGAGSSYVQTALHSGADVLVTGDLTHHTFLDYQAELLLVDAGHFDTEKLFIPLCVEELEKMSFQDKQKIDILSARTNTNPIRFI